VNEVADPVAGSRTVADRLPGGCRMNTSSPPVSEPTPYTLPSGATLTLLMALTRADREMVIHVAPDFSCKVPSSRPPPAAMSVRPAVTASAL
jgi:hypothetical protein